jgi:chemotaxis protein MotB
MVMRKPLSMLSYLIVPAALLLLSSGCTDEVKRLRAANATLSERNEILEGENEQLKIERDRLSQGGAGGKKLIEEQARKIADLEAANQELKKGLTDLKAMYDSALNRPRAPLPAKLNTALQEFAAANPNIAEYDMNNGMVKFKSDLTFPPGEATPNAEASAMLAKLVEILNAPEAKDFAIYVAGHTDDLPIGRPGTRAKHPTNWYLSAHRAVGVEKELTQAGLDPSRVCVMGFGEYHPVEPNQAGHKGNPANRRVEIWIVPAGSFLTPQAN